MRIVIILSLITYAFCGRKERLDGNDPKENYFRYIRTYVGEANTYDDDAGDPAESFPRPGGFINGYPDYRRSRSQRDTNLLSIDEQSLPLELDVLDKNNSTEEVPAAAKDDTTADVVKNDLVINDFIRFKRQAEEASEKGIVAAGDEKSNGSDTDNVRAKREHERNGKMLLSADEMLPEGSRESRGATKDQWIKQPYPVHTTDPHSRYFDDPLPANSELSRAPRVHFVTQRRSESSPPLVYHSYEREGRSRELNRQRDMDLDRDFEPAYYPRPARRYNPQPLENFPYRPLREPYYREDGRRDLDRERYIYRKLDYDYYPFDRHYGGAIGGLPDEDRPAPVASKQKRIIYYATLPEVVRHPSSGNGNGDFRDRYNYRGNSDRLGQDGRYITSPPMSVGPGINYRFRNENPYGAKTRFEDATKSAYPNKVSSPDVNVREIKKNPERRIYSETDRRYPAYKTGDFRQSDFDRGQ